jgi:hypothetical protein
VALGYRRHSSVTDAITLIDNRDAGLARLIAAIEERLDY